MRDTAELSLTEVDIKPQNYNHKTSFTKITKVERFYSFLKKIFFMDRNNSLQYQVTNMVISYVK